METLIHQTMAQSQAGSLTSAFNTYGRKLAAFVRKRVKSLEDAEDILQDVWLQFSSLTELDQIGNISGWLFQVARNRVTDNYRRKKTRTIDDAAGTDEETGAAIRDILLLDTGSNPELALFKDLFWDELLKALDELPENQKQVFIRNEFEEITLQQIADETGENIKTIISRKGYAVKHLRNRLAYLYNEL